jgi:hypothetical protein
MKRFLTVAAGAVCMALSTGAFAQFGGTHTMDATPYQFNVRGGIIVPFDSDLRDLSDVWGAIGLDYRFSKSLLKDGETYASFDWMGRSLDGQPYNVFPLMLNQKFAMKDGQNYTFVGLGVIFFDGGPSDSVFGGRIGAGRMLNASTFVEAALVLSGEAGKRNPSNVGVYLGYRF